MNEHENHHANHGGHGQHGGPGSHHNPYIHQSGGSGHGHSSSGHHHTSGLGSWFNFKDSEYMKGFVMGAAGTYFLTNDQVQKSVAKYLVGLWMNVQESVEEFKEKIEDAKAEIESEKS